MHPTLLIDPAMMAKQVNNQKRNGLAAVTLSATRTDTAEMHMAIF
jgi:hypothetical protein